jgi:hypothetical protein
MVISRDEAINNYQDRALLPHMKEIDHILASEFNPTSSFGKTILLQRITWNQVELLRKQYEEAGWKVTVSEEPTSSNSYYVRFD